MQLHDRFLRSNIPCAIANSTSCLDDITRALQNAYPDVNIEAVNPRTSAACEGLRFEVLRKGANRSHVLLDVVDRHRAFTLPHAVHHVAH